MNMQTMTSLFFNSHAECLWLAKDSIKIISWCFLYQIPSKKFINDYIKHLFEK